MKNLLISLTLLLSICAVSLLSGCIIIGDNDNDASMTCSNLDNYLRRCTHNCETTWDCEREYKEVVWADQRALDKCASCLMNQGNSCRDCDLPEEDIISCQRFLESFWGVSCW